MLVHNLMLLAGIVLSGAGMFVLARRLTGSTAAGLTAGVVFAFAPYRFEHYMHMELQWTVWTPWAFWALDRMFKEGRRRDGALVGLFIALQFMSSIYYGAFLATLLGVVSVVLLIGLRRAVLKQRPSHLRSVRSCVSAHGIALRPPVRNHEKPTGGGPADRC